MRMHPAVARTGTDGCGTVCPWQQCAVLMFIRPSSKSSSTHEAENFLELTWLVMNDIFTFYIDWWVECVKECFLALQLICRGRIVLHVTICVAGDTVMPCTAAVNTHMMLCLVPVYHLQMRHTHHVPMLTPGHGQPVESWLDAQTVTAVSVFVFPWNSTWVISACTNL